METRADELAARELIPLHRLAEEVGAATSPRDAADRLVVDEHMLRVRMDTVTDNERLHLQLAARKAARHAS